MTNVKAILFCIVASICALLSSAQEIPMQYYGTAEGLPSNTVYDIYRDSKGFLWFATDKGVSKYNGIFFENFTAFDGLSDNEIFSFFEDKTGRLWLKTFNGSLCFYKDGKFHNAANTPYLKLPFKMPFILFMTTQGDGSVNVAFNAQTIFINIDSNSVQVYDVRSALTNVHDAISHISGTRRKGYTVVTQEKTIYIDTAGSILRVQNNRPSPFMVLFGNGATYIHGGDGIYTIDKKMIFSFDKSRNFRNYGCTHNLINHRWIHRIFESDKSLFICTNNGMWINDSLQILDGKAVSCVAQDIEGNFWMSALHKGVYKLGADFQDISQQGIITRDEVVFAQVYDSNKMCFTNGNQLHRLKNGKTKRVFSYPESIWRNVQFTNKPVCVVSDNTYYSFVNDNFVVKRLTDEKPAAIMKVPCLFQWKKMLPGRDKLYAIGQSKIFYLNKDTGRSVFLPPLQDVDGHDIRARIFGAATDDEGTLWYSTISQVYKTDGGIPVLQKQFKGIAFKWMEICGNYMIGATQEDHLVICNNFRGNIVIDTVRNQDCIWKTPFRLSDTHLLIATNNVYRLITLSASTNKPVYSINIIENPFLPEEAEYVCSDGDRAFFFKKGLMYSIGIDKLLQKTAPPRLLFTTVKTGARTVNVSTASNKISLPFAESKNIVISFSSLAFSGSGIRYEYSIAQDSGSHWIPLKSEEIYLLAPEYGDYKLKVRAKTRSSDFSKPVVMQLSIIKPFWAESWFRVSCAALLLGILAAGTRFVIRRRLSIKEKKHASEIRFLKSEYKALNALMNPHFIFNSLNSIQGLVNENDGKGANQYLQYFSELVRQNMHNISKELIPLQKEIDLVANYLKLEQLRFHGWLNYEIEIDEEVETELIMIPPLLIQPFVENAIKHGLLPKQCPDNILRVKIYDEGEATIVEIRDNGRGLKRSENSGNASHESYGLSNLTSRIGQLNKINNSHISFSLQELNTEEGKPGGVLVVLEIR